MIQKRLLKLYPKEDTFVKINKYIELYSFSYSDDKFLSFDLEADNKLKQIVLVNIDLPDKLQIRDTLFNVFGKISKKSKNILFINSDLFFDEYIITEIFILRYYKFIKYIENCYMLCFEYGYKLWFQVY